MINNLKVSLLALAFLFTCTLSACCERVDVGNVGIKVNLAGDRRGAEDTPVVSGWVWYMPGISTVIEFPASMQNVVWARVVQEGHVFDESITFASNEGVTINADVALGYHINANHVGKIYTRFRTDVGDGNLETISHGYVRNIVRDALSEVASTMPIQGIYGTRKSELLQRTQQRISARLSPDFLVDQLSFTGALRLPDNVMNAINNAMAATQQAIQAENAVRQRTAEAQQAIATARGQAEAARQRAQGEADAVLIRARANAQATQLGSEAEAVANQRLSPYLTPAVLHYRAMQRWNGELPRVTSSGATPFIQLPQ